MVELPVRVDQTAFGHVSIPLASEGYSQSTLCCTAEPATVPLTVYPASSLPGDLDGSGSVSLGDARLALRLLMGAATASPGILAAADLSPSGGDGRLTFADVRALLALALRP